MSDNSMGTTSAGDFWGIGSFLNGIIGNSLSYNTSEKNRKAQKEQFEKNMAFQREQFDYLKEQNELTRQREDTAIQRRAEDYKNAGMNYLLAGNDGASATSTGTTSFSGTDAAQSNYQYRDVGIPDALRAVNDIYNTMRNKTELNIKRNENLLLEERIKTQVEETLNKSYDSLLKQRQSAKTDSERKKIDKEIEILEQERLRIMHDLGIAKKWRLPYGTDYRPNNPYQLGGNIAGLGAGIIDDLKSESDLKGLENQALQNVKQIQQNNNLNQVIKTPKGYFFDGRFFKTYNGYKQYSMKKYKYFIDKKLIRGY